MKKLAMMGVIVCIASLTVWAANEEPKTDDQLHQIQTKILHNKTLISEKKQQKKVAEKQLGQIAQELKKTEYHLKTAKQSLQLTQAKVRDTETELDKTKRTYSTKSQQFAQRLVEVYKNKHLGALEFIFAPKNFLSAMDSSYYFNRVIKTDFDLIHSIKSQYGQLVSQTQQLKKRTVQLATLKSEIQEKEEDLAQKKQEQHQIVQSLQAQISEMERMNRELEQSSREITSRLMRLSKGAKYLGTGRFIQPAQGFISSVYGYRFHPIFKRRIFHNGVDFASPAGRIIRAADSGTVIVAGEHPQYHGYGKITIIDHGVTKSGKRIATVYAHQSRIFVHEGQLVKQGDEIGAVGSTGYSTGPHLHFEVRVDGATVDPLGYIR